MKQSLGLIETEGLAAGIEAADAAVKSASVELIGYELTKGGGWITIKIQGGVGAVKAAVDAAKMAAARVNRVVSTRVIPRPSAGLDMLVRNPDTIGSWPPEGPDMPEPPTPPEHPAAAKEELTDTPVPAPADTETSLPADEKTTEASVPANEKTTETQTEASVSANEKTIETQTEASVPADEKTTEIQTEASVPADEKTTEIQTEAFPAAYGGATETQTEAFPATEGEGAQTQTESSPSADMKASGKKAGSSIPADVDASETKTDVTALSDVDAPEEKAGLPSGTEPSLDITEAPVPEGLEEMSVDTLEGQTPDPDHPETEEGEAAKERKSRTPAAARPVRRTAAPKGRKGGRRSNKHETTEQDR